MKKKLAGEAFGYYVSMGSSRSYQAVADHFLVARRTVLRTADREEWASRLEAIEKTARETTDRKLADDLAEMDLRHRKMLLAIASRAAKAMSEHPLETGMQGIRAAEVVIKLERVMAEQRRYLEDAAASGMPPIVLM